MKRELREDKLLETVSKNQKQIATRFPTSGLSIVAADVVQVTQEAMARARAIRSSNRWMRACLVLLGLIAVGEAEARTISDRTKAALAAAKDRGVLLGSARLGHWAGREQARLDGLAKARAVAATVRTERAEQAYADLLPAMQEMRENGMTLARIAERLNSKGHTTRRGKPWNPVQVARVLERAGSLTK